MCISMEEEEGGEGDEQHNSSYMGGGGRGRYILYYQLLAWGRISGVNLSLLAIQWPVCG